uniref:Protein kinase domain-containing protein n=1 Tax=Arcella intermedia TaxID=1963864 RepID=A0A6B2L5X4_9EUKA
MKETNFVNFVEWFKAKDEETEEPMIHYVLECADKTLMEYKELTYYQWKAVLFQIFFALHVAQKEYEFVHNDLHFKNILIVEPSAPDEYFEFRDGKQKWYLTGLFVKITDFGLSRIRLEDQRIIYNKKRPETQAFTPMADVEQVMAEMMKIRIAPSSWLAPHEEAAVSALGEGGRERREEMVRARRREVAGVARKVRRFAGLGEILRSAFFEELKERREGFRTPAVVRRRRVVADMGTPGTNRRLSLAVSKMNKLDIPRFQLSDENCGKGEGSELASSGEFVSPSKLKRKRETQNDKNVSKKFKVISKQDVLKERSTNIPINTTIPTKTTSKGAEGPSPNQPVFMIPVLNVIPPGEEKEVELKVAQRIRKVEPKEGMKRHNSITSRRQDREKIFKVFFNT